VKIHLLKLSARQTFAIYLVCLICIPCFVQAEGSNLLKYPVSATLCIEEKSTGFNWVNNQWVPTQFKVTRKYLVKKLPFESYKDFQAKTKNKLIFCNEPKETKISDEGNSFTGFVEVCYENKIVGEESTILNMSMCSEYWSKGKLEKISCDKASPPFFFHPDGQFIRFPWHSDIQRTAENKDSLALTVGSCSKVD
jgi:hypothetical protein